MQIISWIPNNAHYIILRSAFYPTTEFTFILHNTGGHYNLVEGRKGRGRILGKLKNHVIPFSKKVIIILFLIYK